VVLTQPRYWWRIEIGRTGRYAKTVIVDIHQGGKPMSVKPDPIPPVPDETARVAHAAFPHGNVVMTIRDHFGALYTDTDFADLFPPRGQPAESPWRLALVTVLQFLENLTDRQAADAVRARVDWKYSLSLELTDPGFDHTVLSEFRTRLVAQSAEERLLDLILDLCKAQGWLKAHGKQRTDSTHILAKIRALNRLECVGETLFHTLNVLALVAPEWLRPHADPQWMERYAHRVEDYRLPSSKTERHQYANVIGQDGWNPPRSMLERGGHYSWWIADLLLNSPSVQASQWFARKKQQEGAS
jgi:transposase